MEPMNARSKAAAWAWYQRGAGSPASPPPVHSEAVLGTPATAPRCGALIRGGSPSRFKLEADLLLSGTPPIDDISDRFKALHVLPDTSDSTSCAIDVVCMSAAGMLDPPSQSSGSGAPLANTADHLAIVVSSSSYGSASWDCGSALFDSFELVAMSKKLDDAHQLQGGVIEKVCPPVEDNSGSRICDGNGQYGEEDEDEDEEGNNQEATSTGLQPLKLTSLIGMNQLCTGLDAGGSNGELNDGKQSRQAIYDMFCRFESSEATIASSCDDVRAKKTQINPTSISTESTARNRRSYQRRRLHSLSKAFKHHFVQLTRQSHGAPSSTPNHHSPPPDELNQLLQSASLPAKISPQHPKSTCGLESPGRRTVDHRVKAELGCRFEASKRHLRKQYSSNDVHQYHHHHYHHHHHHHLFRHHSDDSLGLLPVTPLLGADISLQVAVAGLRASKANSPLSPRVEDAFIDSKRKWPVGDANSYVAAGSSMESHAFSISHEK